mmetsp:Transcript_47407/g.131822  ORF Transcript_47407/g.131822 Transcript_47407/m.131822 type:complete len:216 (+) Transcript_47407:1569-2216(+)
MHSAGSTSSTGPRAAPLARAPSAPPLVPLPTRRSHIPSPAARRPVHATLRHALCLRHPPLHVARDGPLLVQGARGSQGRVHGDRQLRAGLWAHCRPAARVRRVPRERRRRALAALPLPRIRVRHGAVRDGHRLAQAHARSRRRVVTGAVSTLLWDAWRAQQCQCVTCADAAMAAAAGATANTATLSTFRRLRAARARENCGTAQLSCSLLPSMTA